MSSAGPARPRYATDKTKKNIPRASRKAWYRPKTGKIRRENEKTKDSCGKDEEAHDVSNHLLRSSNASTLCQDEKDNRRAALSMPTRLVCGERRRRPRSKQSLSNASAPCEDGQNHRRAALSMSQDSCAGKDEDARDASNHLAMHQRHAKTGKSIRARNY